MKAITILQPWASLIACGAKRIETRSWATQYRGPIAIHAAKDQDKKGDRIRHIVARAEQYGIIIPKMQFGCVIATANLVDCIEIVHFYTLAPTVPQAKRAILDNGHTVSGNEIDFGDFTPGRYAWILDNIQAIKPVTARGQQRIWNWEGEAI